METSENYKILRLREALEQKDAETVARILQPMLPAGIPKLEIDPEWVRLNPTYVTLGKRLDAFWDYEFEVGVRVDHYTMLALECDMSNMIFQFVGMRLLVERNAGRKLLFRDKAHELDLDQVFKKFSALIMEWRTKPVSEKKSARKKKINPPKTEELL